MGGEVNRVGTFSSLEEAPLRTQPRSGGGGVRGVFGRLFRSSSVAPLSTNSISSPGIANPEAIKYSLQSTDLEVQGRALDELLTLTKWTANPHTRRKEMGDEAWRIFYIENGNRDQVFQAGMTKHVARHLRSSSPSVQSRALSVLCNLAAFSDDQRAAEFLKCKIVQTIATEHFLTRGEGGESFRTPAATLIKGLLGAPNVGREANRAVHEAGLARELLQSVLDKDSEGDTQVQLMGALLAVVLPLRHGGAYGSNADREWEKEVIRTAVSLCQGTFPALQNVCLHVLLVLARNPAHAVFCVEESIPQVLSVLLHSHNPAVFRSRSSHPMDNGILVCKVLSTICLSDKAYVALLAAAPSAPGAILGFLRSALDINQLSEAPRGWDMLVDVDDAVALCERRSGELALQCCGAAWLLSLIVQCAKHEDVMARLRGRQVVGALKGCAKSHDAFVYQFAARSLGELELFEEVPFFQSENEAREAPKLDSDPRKWSEQDVLSWVETQRFAIYESVFKTSWVDGELLTTLSDEDLAAMGVTNPIHRRYMLRAISAVGGDDNAVANPSKVLADKSASSFDVFISYRRSTGAELAQLLKMHLERMGFSVFLDVDCLGKGDFIAHILNSLENSQHFVPVLTNGESGRTVGYFDRCKGDDAVEDNVHKEIVHAVKSKRRIVPVFVAGYVWPKMDELPDVCRAITGHNAVEWIPQYHTAALEKLARFLQG